MDCLERYVKLGFDGTFTGEDIRFEAVGTTRHTLLKMMSLADIERNVLSRVNKTWD